MLCSTNAMHYFVLFLHLFALCGYCALDWKPILPEYLALKEGKIDPKADAEAIFWEAWVEDTMQGGYSVHKVENYIRVKLFNTRAVEKWGDVEVPFFPEQNMSIADFRGRVIKADGTIVEVKGGQVKESVKSKTKGSNYRVKSFAFPGLEPGVIIEYQFTEVFSERLMRYVRLPMQLDVPAWEINYHVKPISPMFLTQGETMQAYPFNCQPTAWEPVKAIGLRQGFVRTGVKNMKAFVEEPDMPAEDDVKAWMLIYYTTNTKDKPADFWKNMGRKLRSTYNRDVKVSGEIKQLAAQLVTGKADVLSKAEALAIHCQTKIQNVAYRAAGMTAEARENFYKKILKENYDSADTLKNGIGRSGDIRALFFALAEAAGLHPVWVAATSATGALLRADLLDPYLLDNQVIAIPDGEKMHYFNPGVPYMPPGMLDWDEQGQAGLLCDEKEPKLVSLPYTAPEFTHIERTAKMALDGNGTIRGDVTMRYFGHAAMRYKRDLDDLSPAEREETIRKRYEGRFPGAQITELKIENADVPMGVFTIKFQMSMEGYGQRTGKRLFFQPALFNLGDRERYSSATRTYPLLYDYAFFENDVITLTLPEGFSLEQAEMPAALDLGPVGSFQMTATLDNAKPVLTVKRKFIWGKNGNVFFDAKAYGAVKQAWTALHSANTHQLTLRAQ